MAILITNSTPFKPMSFDEMIKPHLLATEAYNEIEKGIADLDAEAATIKQLAMSEPEGSETRTRYEQYAAELESKASDLASKGLRGINKKSLYDLQAQYNNKIRPIDTAAKMRAAEIAEQKEGMKDPTMRYSRNAATTSLDYYLNNTTPSYDRISGASLAGQVKDMAVGLAKQMRENPRQWSSILEGQYWQTKQQSGFTDEEILLAAANDPNAPAVLRNIVNDVVQSSRIFDWEGARDSEGNLTDYGQELNNWAWREASKGLWGAIGETKYQTLDNWRAKMAEEEAMRQRAAQRTAQQERFNGLVINPMNLYNNREMSDKEEEYKDNIKKYSQYFENINGKWVLTKDGKNMYERNTPSAGQLGISPTGGQIANTTDPTYDNDFKKFIDSIMGNNKSIGEAWSAYVNSPIAESSKYDATKATEFDYTIDETQQGGMKDAIITAARGFGELTEVDYDASSRSFKGTGETLSLADLDSNNYKVTATRFSPYGATVIIKGPKGKSKRYLLPSGINQSNENFRDAKMKEVLSLQEVLKDPNLSEKDKLALSIRYSEALQEAYLYHSQLLVQNKTHTQDINPYSM